MDAVQSRLTARVELVSVHVKPGLWTGVDYGLDRTGLWTGLDWTAGLDWTGLD